MDKNSNQPSVPIRQQKEHIQALLDATRNVSEATGLPYVISIKVDVDEHVLVFVFYYSRGNIVMQPSTDLGVYGECSTAELLSRPEFNLVVTCFQTWALELGILYLEPLVRRPGADTHNRRH